MNKMTLEVLKEAVAGHAAAFRCVTDYQPAGGPGDKVFPPTYEGGRYAVEDRLIGGERLPCVLLDSVQSQANRMELALLEAARSGDIALPIIETHFKDKVLLKPIVVTSLEAPHRIADAIFRDSLLEENGEKVMFRKSQKGKILDSADVRNATGLFGLCPTALIFGIWDSTGPRGGLGAKIQRAVVSEMVGINAQPGCKTSSRIDPLQIRKDAGLVLKREASDNQNPDWMLSDETAGASTKKGAAKKAGKKPSEINHGNVVPTIDDETGGFTIEKAVQKTVLSLAAIRRLRFPVSDHEKADVQVDLKARTVLAALGLLAAVLVREEGADLRSRCQLIPTQTFMWELLDKPGETPKTFELDAETAMKIFKKALQAALGSKLPWENVITLEPHPQLVELVARSQDLEAREAGEEGE